MTGSKIVVNEEQVAKMKAQAETEGWIGLDDITLTPEQAATIEDVLKKFNWESVVSHLHNFDDVLGEDFPTFSELREQAKTELIFAFGSKSEHYYGQCDGFTGRDYFRAYKNGKYIELSFVIEFAGNHPDSFTV